MDKTTNKEKVCKYFVVHYVKEDNMFKKCGAGHCELQKKEGILIAEAQTVCACFEPADVEKRIEEGCVITKRFRADVLKNTEELLKLLGDIK